MTKEQKYKKPPKDLNDYVDKAREKNKEAKNDIPWDASIKLLQQNTGHLQWLLYMLVGAFLVAASAGWQFYLHLDNKIEHKMDYMNLRIDNIISHEEIKRNSK